VTGFPPIAPSLCLTLGDYTYILVNYSNLTYEFYFPGIHHARNIKISSCIFLVLFDDSFEVGHSQIFSASPQLGANVEFKKKKKKGKTEKQNH
jgi:hypothetical protein